MKYKIVVSVDEWRSDNPILWGEGALGEDLRGEIDLPDEMSEEEVCAQITESIFSYLNVEIDRSTGKETD